MKMFLLNDRLRLLFKSRSKRIQYLKKLPVEKRYFLTYGLFSYNWKYASGWYKNIRDLIDFAITLRFPKRQIPRDSWDLYTSVSCWILPRLRWLKKNKQGTPCQMYEGMNWPLGTKDMSEGDKILQKDVEDKAVARWDAIMDDIIYAYEYHLLLSLRYCGYPSKDKQVADKMEQRFDKGMEYYHKYFSNLWD